MKKFEGKEAIIVEFEGFRFAKEGNKLWVLNKHEWRYKQGDAWETAAAGQQHSFGDYREIKLGGKIFAISTEGFEEIPQISTEYMIHAIAEKLDLLEWTNAKLYALLEHTRIELGCGELRAILLENDLIKNIHKVNERTLYRFQWSNVVRVALLKYEKEIKEIYERICK